MTEELGVPRFIVDHNVGKLARWLRLMGYDTKFFKGGDSDMVVRAFDEDRIILTRNTRIALRWLVKSGRLKVFTFITDDPEEQICQLIEKLNIKTNFAPFTLCLECNRALEERQRGSLKDRLPPYVYQTQARFMECPSCHRLYWQGTHWRAMTKRLERLNQC